MLKTWNNLKFSSLSLKISFSFSIIVDGYNKLQFNYDRERKTINYILFNK